MLNLPGYEEINQVYTGNRTLVYRAIQVADKQPVIIKVLRNPHPNFHELVKFRNQYIICHNLQHPYIVQPLDWKRYGNGYALIMADYGMISLAQYWQQSERSLYQLLNITIQLTEALHYLSQQQIIHKDIKPSNIIINPQTANIKLIDFSISSLLPKEAQQIANPQFLEGTLAYISPEQTGRMNRGIDYRTDFYALGVTLYELLTGEVPFSCDDAMELVHCHIAKMPKPEKRQMADGTKVEIPQVLSDMIIKLMAKNAEDRYQSALGIQHDLQRCLQELETRGEITTFELGQRDICDRFLIPEKLYGRVKEVQTLWDAFERVANGNLEMILVAGFSGIGKTAVVHELHKPITRRHGYFIQGKFDQFNRNIPFSAFVQAFRSLMGQLLGESDADLANWKAQILEVLGENGQVIMELIPELEQIIGQQPPVLKLSGSAAQNRFNLLFSQFIQIFTTKEHPLVIFLDDLQWMDSASLKLLQLLSNKSELGYLLILAAYRDNEVLAADPLMLVIDQIRKQQRVNTVTLTPLQKADINLLVADTLLCSPEIALPVSELIYQKTQGNPLFTTQFLQELYRDDCIVFDHNLGYWLCDLTQLQQLAVTDDLVEFMVGRLRKLSQANQDVLKIAACIGNQFNLATLAIVCEQSQEDIANNLWPSLQLGLIIPENQTYKFFQQRDLGLEPVTNITVSYRFLHDRVQQAAYTLIADQQKAITHYHIGQLLLKQTDEQSRAEGIFELVNQLNYGINLINEARDFTQLAELNLIAADKAKAATAYQAASEYAGIGLSLLGKEGWQQEYAMTLGLHNLAAELAALCGDFTAMEDFVNNVIQHSRSPLERIDVYRTRIFAHACQNQLTTAISVAQGCLQQLGINFPDTPTQKHIQQEIAEIYELTSNQEIENLINLPMMTDEQKIAIVRIANSIIPATHISGSPLFPLVVSLSVKLSIQYGNTSASAYAYSCYGIIGCILLQDIETGVKFGQLALEVVDKLDSKTVKPEVLDTVAMFILHRKSHLQETIPLLQASYQAGLEVGNLEYVGYAAQSFCLHSLWCGKPLTELEQKTRAYCHSLVQLNQLTTANWCRIYWQCMANLLGLSQQPSILSGAMFKTTELLPQLQSAQDLIGLYFFYLHQMMLGYLFGKITLAEESAITAREYLQAGIGFIGEPGFYFYDSLIALAVLSGETGDKSQQTLSAIEISQLWQRIEQNQTQLQEKWANYAPANYQHKVDLVTAEKCRILGQKAEAIELYDTAIAAAKTHEYLQEESLANELAAKFYWQWGKDKVASAYMQEAYYVYVRWQAKAKIEDLENRYPHLLWTILPAQDSNLLSSAITACFTHCQSFTTNNTGIGTILDFASLMKAYRTLSREIESDRAVANLMQVMGENAGAETVVLMLFHDKTLMLEAKVTNGCAKTVEVIPVETSNQIPLKIINTVKRTQEVLVLENASQEPNYLGDTYIQKYQPVSILCLPLSDHGRQIGILYLENNQSSGAFSKNRVQLLSLLCAQAAITLENARLYEQAQQALKLEKELHDLQRTQLQLIQSEKMFSLGKMVGGIAHEINNPITFIHSNINYANQYMQEILELLNLYQNYYPHPHPEIHAVINKIDLEFLRQDFQKLLQSMRIGSDRIREIVLGLRNFSRLDEKGMKFVNLQEGLENSLLIIQHRLKLLKNGREITLDKKYGDIPKVYCYPSQINQVFLEILTNAIDVLEVSHTIEKPEIQITTAMKNEQTVRISITDNGMGMSENIHQHIFDPFFTTKPVGQGTGLGLSISYQIVTEQHKGQLNCISQPGQGAEFIIDIPVLY